MVNKNPDVHVMNKLLHPQLYLLYPLELWTLLVIHFHLRIRKQRMQMVESINRLWSKLESGKKKVTLILNICSWPCTRSTGLDYGHVLFLWRPSPLKCKKWPINDKTEWTSLVNKGFTKWFKDYTKNYNTKSRNSFCFSSFWLSSG